MQHAFERANNFDEDLSFFFLTTFVDNAVAVFCLLHCKLTEQLPAPPCRFCTFTKMKNMAIYEGQSTNS